MKPAAPAKTTPVIAATSVHTGEPFRGAQPRLLLLGSVGFGLVGRGGLVCHRYSES